MLRARATSRATTSPSICSVLARWGCSIALPSNPRRVSVTGWARTPDGERCSSSNRHRRSGPHTNSSPGSNAVGARVRSPLTNTPLAEPKSCTTICGGMTCKRAWCRDKRGSLKCTPQSSPRPMTVSPTGKIHVPEVPSRRSAMETVYPIKSPRPGALLRYVGLRSRHDLIHSAGIPSGKVHLAIGIDPKGRYISVVHVRVDLSGDLNRMRGLAA